LLAGTPGDKTPLNCDYCFTFKRCPDFCHGLFNLKKGVPILPNTPPLTGRGATITSKIDANFNPVPMAQPVSTKRRHDAHLLRKYSPYHGTRLRECLRRSLPQ
jgi:hypothetical protein